MTSEQTTSSTSTRYQVHSDPLGKRGMKRIWQLISYIWLIFGACFMLFPLLWMLSASLKPEWQIFTRPPIWLPQEWIQVDAGDENTGINTYTVKQDGDEQEVIRLGRRRFTTVIDMADIEAGMISVPQDELSGAAPKEVGGAPLNVRTWQSPDGARDVVALARDGDNMAVIETDKITSARVLPLGQVNSADRYRPEINGVKFQGREIEEEDSLVPVMPLGPESELVVISETSVSEHAILAYKTDLDEEMTAPIGNSALDVFTLAGDDSGAWYVVVTEESWHPVLELDVVVENAITVPNEQLIGDPVAYDLPNISLEQYEVALDDGTTEDIVVILPGAKEAVVLPVEFAEDIRLGPVSKLAQDQASKRVAGGGIIRYKDRFDEFGTQVDVAIVGLAQEMVIAIPIDAIPDAFDVEADALDRNTKFHLQWENFHRALTAEIGGANFLTFFKNSGFVVLLNLIGHFLSVTVVAYAFARLRAPGKNILFAILLSTMMLPFPVTLIPVYEIFRDLNMIDTLSPLYIRAFFGNAFFIFLLRQFFTTIPMELEEAARIDGANTFQILTRLILPLSTPALATMAIFTFLWSWNDFFTPFVFINSPSNYTATVGLNMFKGHFTTNYEVLMAASVVVVTPTIVLFFFLQRYFIEGIQLTGLKG